MLVVYRSQSAWLDGNVLYNAEDWKIDTKEFDVEDYNVIGRSFVNHAVFLNSKMDCQDKIDLELFKSDEADDLAKVQTILNEHNWHFEWGVEDKVGQHKKNFIAKLQAHFQKQTFEISNSNDNQQQPIDNNQIEISNSNDNIEIEMSKSNDKKENEISNSNENEISNSTSNELAMDNQENKISNSNENEISNSNIQIK